MSTYTPQRRLEHIHPYPDMHDIALHLAGADTSLTIGRNTLFQPVIAKIFEAWVGEISIDSYDPRRGYEAPATRRLP